VLPAGLSVLQAQTPDQVLVVVNKRSVQSREIGQYYIRKRGIPLANLCTIDTTTEEHIARAQYGKEIETPIASFLQAHGLTEKILYITMTHGIPVVIPETAAPRGPLKTDSAAVDSELTLLYQRLHGLPVSLAGPANNPFYRQRDTPFRHPLFPMYLVARLDAYTMEDMKGMVDRALEARNTGRFVIDLRAEDRTEGNQWLRNAALLLPKERVLMDDSAKVLANVRDVIGYASWGSNDRDHRQRFLHMQWLPGAIATEFVSTDGRTFTRPPEAWKIGAWSDDPKTWFLGSPQSLATDYIHEGASGASGQAEEPYLGYCPRPDFVLPAYFSGRTLAESFYMGIPGLSWMNLVIGDPLMRLKP